MLFLLLGSARTLKHHDDVDENDDDNDARNDKELEEAKQEANCEDEVEI
jgi:hypothetical protein